MKLFAMDFLRSGVLPLQTAHACSHDVAASIVSGQDVVLSFEGFRGASSSFFNAFWLSLLDSVGTAGLAHLRIETTSRVLADVIDRSRKAAIDRYASSARVSA